MEDKRNISQKVTTGNYKFEGVQVILLQSNYKKKEGKDYVSPY